jgi:hypothetical protein
MRVIYAVVLRFLPSDFRTAFGAAMLADFSVLLREARARGRGAALRCVIREIVSLGGCVACEWAAKLTAAPFQRDMIFRDPSVMRPPGASKQFWYANL